MKLPRPPRFETRRAKQLEAELRARAHAWIPSWSMDDGERDFGRALLEIAARLGSEVAERLDRMGEKNRLGFLDWLAVRGEAARPARLPVVFKLADSAREAKPAVAGTRLQVEAAGASVVLETETGVLVLPRGLQALVGVDGAADAFYLAPPGLSSLAPPEPLPAQWQLRNFAAAGATRLQFDPQQGLAAGMVIALGDKQYRITQANQDIVTVAPPLARDHAARSTATKVTVLAPFDGAAASRQEHLLYIGDPDLFNIEAQARIEITGAKLLANMAWHYWGKKSKADEAAWLPLLPAEAGAQAQSEGIVLDKLPGSMELLELVPGRASRWIRASAGAVESDRAPLRDAFGIRINCPAGGVPPSCADRALPTTLAQGMANTTPLMLGDVFFPLGKEPRQFDAFYLGSEEAFSKKCAQVLLCFEMADPIFASLTSLGAGPLAHLRLAGVAADRQLHLFQFVPADGVLARLPNRLPLRPPAPALEGAPPAEGNLSIPLDPKPPYRVPVWPAGGMNLCVAVAARGAVWLWHENGAAPEQSGWSPLDVVDPAADPKQEIDGLVYLAGGEHGYLVALRSGRLFVCNLDTPGLGWKEVATSNGKVDVTWARIAPIRPQTGDTGNGSLAAGLVAVSAGGQLFGITFPAMQPGRCHHLGDGVATTVTPAAVRRDDGHLVAVAMDTGSPPHLVAFRCAAGPENFTRDIPADDVALGTQDVAGGMLDLNFNAATLTVTVSLGKEPGSSWLASWVPFAPPGLNALFRMPVPAVYGAAAGAPTLLPAHVLVPTSTNQVIAAGFDLARRLDIRESLRTAIIAADAHDRFAVGDRLAVPVRDAGGATKYELRTVEDGGIEFQGQALYEFDLDAGKAPLFFYPGDARKLSANIDAAASDTIVIDAGDPPLAAGSFLLIINNERAELYAVASFDAGTRRARLDRHLAVIRKPPTVEYVAPQTSQAQIRPLLHLDPGSTGNWPAEWLDRVGLFFPGAAPAWQGARAYLPADGKPERVVLAEQWTDGPPETAGKVRFIVDGTVGKWTVHLGDTSGNPELSWEYWNGKGWWKLDLASHDGTLSLKKTGSVRFKVPDDLEASDWAGKTNYWIRARLIGGDYGREQVSVTTTYLGKGKSEQKVHRSLEGIRAPSVASLRVCYSVCEPAQPASVLVQDSGSMRDQSDANRTQGARVEAFVPLALQLGQLSSAPDAAATAGDRAPGCCPGPGTGAEADGAPVLALGRALYLGFDAPLLGEPVNLLLLVEERPHEAFAPMRVEALVADRFVPIAVDDATRALGESGVLTLAFPVAPTLRELFGQTLRWLRLSPAAGSAGQDWKPKLLGAYLNGVWATAAETLTRELVGSSQGEPNLTLHLARPPVLHDSLELRVKEPLGEEEVDELNADNADQVLTTLDRLPGCWVLWKQVADPGDEAPTARVYALDEASGEIRFGDGRHGKIVPIGRDSILAMTYRRSEPAAPGALTVPGNAITARTSLNLVSPIDGVEEVVAADRAAGGAAPQDADLVLRYGAANLRHRERALTARDVEDIVLERSPDVAQARCFRRQGHVQLVVVMRGSDPMPAAAQRRALQRMLVAAAPPALAAPQALRIRGPVLRSLRVELRLRVASLDDAGDLAREVRKRVTALFDSASGGVEGGGWPLGASPGAADIAVALVDLAHLEGIASIELRDMTDDAVEQPWPGSLAPTELAWLIKDGVRIAFESGEVAA